MKYPPGCTVILAAGYPSKEDYVYTVVDSYPKSKVYIHRRQRTPEVIENEMIVSQDCIIGTDDPDYKLLGEGEDDNLLSMKTGDQIFYSGM